MNLSVFANVLKPAEQLCVFVLKLVTRGHSLNNYTDTF